MVCTGHAEDSPQVGATLKLRLSLLITALMVMATLAGGFYVVHKTREDARAEASSTLALAGHFLDVQIEALQARWSVRGYSPPQFKFRELGDIRHLRVAFYDAAGDRRDGNETVERREASAPPWFADWVRRASQPVESDIRQIDYRGANVGRVVISPDPRYETGEMWAICQGLLELLLGFFLVVNAAVWWAASRAMRPVEKILEALRDLRQGNLAVRLPAFGLPELSRISIGFNHMAETLERSVNENQRLTRQLLNAQETERTRIARELHDEIGQCVSAIHADAAAIRNRGGESVRESAEAIVEVAKNIKHIVRSMLRRLRPPLMEGLGLLPALRDLVAAFQQRSPRVACTLRASSRLTGLEGEIGLTVYRVIQECLTNISVHANAEHAGIEVALLDHAGSGSGLTRLQVMVEDDGVGFLPAAVSRGFGLAGVQERVKGLGGKCRIDSQPGRGTRIVAEMPLALAADTPA